MTDLPRVDFDELELVITDEQYMYWKGQPFTGIAVEFFPDGTLRSEVYHVNGSEHGPSREWYPSGQLKEEANLWHGGLHGYERIWDEQGRLISERLGELGIAISEKSWDEQGRLLRDWRMGPQDNLYSTLQIKRQRWGKLAPPIC